jgi:hypothetical protein
MNKPNASLLARAGLGTRLLALVVALAVVSAPVALEVCQITCESKAMERSVAHDAEGHAAHHHMPADHASCHEHAAGVDRMSPGNVPCDHGTEATPSSVAAKNSDAAVSMLAVLPLRYSTATVETPDFASARESAPSARLAIPLTIPLRV